MATCYCECGAKYRVPENAVGKCAKCKQCGAVFTLRVDDDGPIPLADDLDEAVRQSEASPALTSEAERSLPPGSPAALAGATFAHGYVPASTSAGRSYWSNVLWSFLFVSHPGELVTFIVIWGCLVVAPMIPFVGWFLNLMLIAWFAAFRLNIVASAAAGEDRLPDVEVFSDFAYDIIEPLLRWMASWAVVFLPAIAYLIYALRQGKMTGTELLQTLAGGMAALSQGATSGEPVFDVLLYGGMAMWPMVVLCLALGGFETLYRPDLMVLTIARTLPAYLVTLGLMFGITLLVRYGTTAAIAGVTAPAGQSPAPAMGGAIVAEALVVGMNIYLEIVLMRLIGLYYHHFKQRFAWDWG